MTSNAGSFRGTMNRLSTVRHAAGTINGWLPMLLAFSLPLSTSGISVTALLILLLWLVEGGLAGKGREIMANPVCVVLLAYLGLHLLGLLWTDNMAQGLAMLDKQWKLALMPVFLTTVRYEWRRRYVAAYVAGTAVAVLLTYLAWFGLFHYSDITPTHLTHGTVHVVYNPMLALAIYLVLHEILWGDRGRPARLALAVLAVLMILDMFITEGRTGQLVFFVLMALLLIQWMRQRLVLAILLCLVLVPLSFVAAYRLSPMFQQRVDQVRSEVAAFGSNPETSVGLRLLFWRNSLEIIRAHPLFGVGTGDFRDAYAQVNRRRSPTMVATDNPHNQYVLVLCQFGLVGLALLLALFAVQVRQAFRIHDGWQRIRLAFPLFFLTIMLTESYLVVYETGFLFALLGAVFYKVPLSAVAGREGRLPP